MPEPTPKKTRPGMGRNGKPQGQLNAEAGPGRPKGRKAIKTMIDEALDADDQKLAKQLVLSLIKGAIALHPLALNHVAGVVKQELDVTSDGEKIEMPPQVVAYLPDNGRDPQPH